jgi:hypothetical protein
MFWGPFSVFGFRPLYVVEGSMNQVLYKKVLEEEVFGSTEAHTYPSRYIIMLSNPVDYPSIHIHAVLVFASTATR